MSRFNQHEKGVRQHEPNPACQHDRTQYRTPFLVEADGEVLGASCAVIGVSAAASASVNRRTESYPSSKAKR